MKITEININEVSETQSSVFNQIYDGKVAGVIIRDFFDENIIETIKQCFYNYSNSKFEPAKHYKALPRPFAGILGEEKLTVGYENEINYLNKNNFAKKLGEIFASALKHISEPTEIILSVSDQDYSLSKNWFSIRELMPNGGTFDIHCGNYFVDWNEYFFKHHQNKHLYPNNHLSFLAMIQRPESSTDITIFDAHWNTVKERVDLNTLRDIHKQNLKVRNIPQCDIRLFPGDLLIFDESNYWHKVAEFKGFKSRLTFGGFISKFRDEDKVLFWA